MLPTIEEAKKELEIAEKSKKNLISIHTILNKITGLLLFLFPLTLKFIELEYDSVVICIFATFAAIQEGYYVKKDVKLLDADC